MATDAMQEHGHFFTKKSFHKPTYCHHCTDLLWGLIGQGLMCKVCNYVIHEKCFKQVATPCTSYLTDHIKNPSAHCWSDCRTFKKKFCNVCRRKLEDSAAYRCEVCECYAHLECKDFVVSNCKQCATYTPHIDQNTVVHFHHWREGNLPSNSKCSLCKKTCWSGDCLTGYRCEWCALTAHPNCRRRLPVECSFGSLRKIFLPPYCVTVPRLDFNIETLLSFTKPSGIIRSVSSEWPSTESRADEELPLLAHPTVSPTVSAPTLSGSKSPREAKSEKDELDKIFVYDGNASYKDGIYRVVNMPKSVTVANILDEVLRLFHMPPEPDKFYLSVIGETEDVRLDERYKLKDYISTPAVGWVHSFYLRRKEKERGELSIYIDSLLPLQEKATSNCVCIPVTMNTSAQECMRLALVRFGLANENIDDFVLTTILVDKAIIDRKLELDERPFSLIQSIAKDSVCRARMTRFYIQLKEDPHGSLISIFISNLPISLTQHQYRKILLDIIGEDNLWSVLDAIYYEYGSLVISYTSGEKASTVFQLLNSASFASKSLYVMLLPKLQAHMMADTDCPLLVFVNTRSGGCQGQQLITWFKQVLNPHQVFDLLNGGPLPGLYVFRSIRRYRMLVCGGDGTVGWVLQCLDNVGQDAVCDAPPIAVLPLGTGNDLARVLRWGSGYTGTEDLMSLLHDIIDAEDIQLDRWTVIFHPEEKETDETKVALANDTQMADTNEDTTQMFVMNNYMGFGIDAELSLDFHNARQKNPEKFNSRLHNKGVYFKMSLKKMANRPSKPLNQLLVVEVDGRVLDFPSIEGLIILNIFSWASGSHPWGPERDVHFSNPNHWDGLLEVIGVTGVVHMGKISGGLGSAIRLAQGAHLKISMKDTLPIHIDGEPWIQPKGQCIILKSALKATMMKKTKAKVRRRDTEPNLTFGEPHGAMALSQSSEQTHF